MSDDSHESMGDVNKAGSFLLPPGCRFCPSEEQLLCYYLSGKNANSYSDDHANPYAYGFNLITELEFYGLDPFELPDHACYSYGYGGRKTHWYCYTLRVLKESRGRRRRSKSGFWRRRGRAREVVGMGVGQAGKAVLGTRTSFTFYLGNSPKTAVRTHWVLYEYALIDHPQAPFALCRVLFKSHCRNKISENGLNSYAEEIASAVRQHGGTLTPEISYNKVPGGNAQIMTSPFSASNIQFPSVIQRDEQVTTSNLLSGCSDSVEDLEAEHLLSIIKDDFLELDDLVD